MSNYTPNTLSGDLAPVNAELTKISTAIASQLDRNPNGGQANQMESVVDMNSNKIINLAAPTNDNDAARLADIVNATTGVVSFNGRQGVVLPAASDYDASQVDNDSGVTGATVANALDTLNAKTFNTSQVTNSSTVTGSTATDALDSLQSQINSLPSPLVMKGFLDVSAGDGALPVSPSDGDTYQISVGGTITVTKNGDAAAPYPVNQGDKISYFLAITSWVLQDADGLSLQPIDSTVVGTTHTVVDSDSGKFMVFNNASDVTVTLNDSSAIGVSVAMCNIGGGNVILSAGGTSVIRGATTLGDVTGYLAVTKLTSTIWQSSERV